ncbi:pyridoxal phosphate-dependent decarboxylase family protein [Leisingera methylohalidivorans]|uniref:Pyridoxal-dependent decarboxylase n=1 Tax=Leisingera methylohalidivorans DSM 14336 TaxID=999552 RepID=V9W0E4_9RHOB|nr:pyridoxal-dependent decarboxylase [Leisingera methylohalidivorans]AHD03628.1 pyridoxal-dependent decarboxylase [Leisingera methylohalidivorans DSM 14336]
MAKTYLQTIHDRAVAVSDEAIAALSGFDTDMPTAATDPTETLCLLNTLGSPATTATTSGRFFGLVVGGTLPAALGARILTSAWDQVVFNDATSPIGVKLEQVAAKWLLDVLGLPAQSSVGFVTGATMANFTCLAGARHAILAQQGWDVLERGLWGAPRLRVIAGAQSHVTVLKALTMLGVGTDVIEWVPCDEQGRMDANHLPAPDENTIILAQSGNVNSGASDPVAQIVERANGAWVHVDGAFGLWAAASDTTRDQLAGYESADSWVVDGHKWLNTPYECGLAICKHPTSVHAAMATQAPYLKVGGDAAPKDMVPEFSRSARGVEIWAALHSLGRDGLSEMINRTSEHAQTLAAGLRKQGFEVLNEVVLNQVVASLPLADGWAAKLAADVQNSGDAWFGPTNWQGREAIRFSVSSWATTDGDIQRTLDAIACAKEGVGF